MTELLLDGGALHSREDLHDLLSEALGLPAYYGRNLDALYDCLTEQGEPVRIRVRSPEALPYGARLLRTLRDAAEENPAIFLELEET